MMYAVLHPPNFAAQVAALMRISFLTGIFKALNICCGQDLADRWVTLPNQNPLFAGEAPVDYMIQHGCSDMKQVRRLLDARCAGH
jgi:hypothetical protein